MTSLNSRSLVSAAVRAQLETDEQLELQRQLGAGTYARVRQAFSRAYGTQVAVKIIDRRKAKQDFVAHFLPRELAIIQRLRHPNIIRLLKTVDTEHVVCIVTELAANGDLLARVRAETRLAEPLAKKMYRQLIEGLHYLHDLNIAHRDLKCENILLDKWDNVKIGDFGFAREMNTVSHTFCGSRAYAPPEILQARPYDHCLVDTWSAGVILYIMVTGSMPFSEKHVNRMVKQQLRRELHYPSRAADVGADCRALIRATLHPDADRRPTYSQQVHDAWLVDVDWVYRTDAVIYVLTASRAQQAQRHARAPPHESAVTTARARQ